METIRNLNRSERRKIAHSKPMQKAATEYWKAFWADKREQITTAIACKRLSSWIKHPKRKVFGVTWLDVVNFLLLQWLFVRLIAVKAAGVQTWKIIRFVVPLTGWKSNYQIFWGNI
jgi:hypothetical protein